MPPKPRITREMILQAAFAIAREAGIGAVNARSVSARLGCSTQPVLYCFAGMEELRREVYRMADEMHSQYLMRLAPEQDPMIGLGLNYIRFAREERELFRLLFQSDGFGGRGIGELMDMEELAPVLRILAQEAGLSMEQSRRAFLMLLMLVHGWASMLANNTMEYDEEQIVPTLEMAFMGMVGMMKQEGMNE